MTVAVYMVPPVDIPKFWSECEPIIERSLKHAHGESSILGIRQNLIAGQTQLWVVIDDETIIACAVMQIIQYELKRTYRGLYLAGEDMDKWLGPLDKALERYARQWGCKEIELFGRKGWLRKLKNMNYAEGYSMVRRELG